MSTLNPVELRILGALIEKERTTPDYYPLSLNALTLACNQSSNRDPVMQLDEAVVVDTIARLREKALVRATRGIDSRVTKYSHLLAEKLELDTGGLAVLCVLMLRGAQTVGELKTRTARLAEFESAADIESTLTELATRKLPLVRALPRRGGQKETRYAQLLGGEPVVDTADVPTVSSAAVSDNERITSLETTVAELKNELADVRQQLDEFRKQFE